MFAAVLAIVSATAGLILSNGVAANGDSANAGVVPIPVAEGRIEHSKISGPAQTGDREWRSDGAGSNPIVIPLARCDSYDLSGFAFQAGDCTFDHLKFDIKPHGVTVEPDPESDCCFGRMKIPGNDNYYKALELKIGSVSDHSIGGMYYPAELQILHEEESQEERKKLAVFSVFFDGRPQEGEGGGDHENAFEGYLKGWEAVAVKTSQHCTSTLSEEPEGNAAASTASQQQLAYCQAIRKLSEPKDELQLSYHDKKFGARNAAKMPASPMGPSPSIYNPSPNSGFYTYEGSLTTTPCAPVTWVQRDKPLYVTSNQMDRLLNLVLCYVDRESCEHRTEGSAFGGNNTPPHSLSKRKLLHHCKSIEHQESHIKISSRWRRAAGGSSEESASSHPYYAILFPWFVMALGFIVYYLLSRFLHFIPYTAVLFILGTFMGVGIVALENTDQLSTSIRMWNDINSEVLLLVFLPGLLFRDAFCLNVYLLKDALVQCLIMAFPMVLAGSALLALVGYYILPYGWSFSLCMTFGAILSATDPVAVSALLNEVGAPPRLKMHIAGESLLNDGSAIVFYVIFGSMFLYELGIPGLGKDVDVISGFALFFRMSLGAVAIGLAFGIGLVRVLHHFNRRYNHEESVVQVTSSITIAYLTYYVAEPVCHTSGVLAVVTCGFVTKAFGEQMINDRIMMEKFWVLVEHLLNTLIFALGGVVWGTVISNSDPRRNEKFSGTDWGYLFLVYLLMLVIRTFLFSAFFPLISRIGLKSNLKEMLFISFGGLRGAVGIAMAVALDHELTQSTTQGDSRRDFTSQLFGLTGGIALLTLLINGTLCGPLLKKLGLADSTEMRAKIVEQYRHGLMQHVLDALLKKLSEARFGKADFAVIRRHVPVLAGLTSDELKLAVKRQKASTPTYEYKKPNLESFRNFVGEQSMNDIASLARVSSAAMLQGLVNRTTLSSISLSNMGNQEGEQTPLDETELMELRKLFIELLKFAYREQVDSGDVEVREGMVVFTLEKSLEYTADAVAEGSPICDWEKIQMLDPIVNWTKEILDMRTKEIGEGIATGGAQISHQLSRKVSMYGGFYDDTQAQEEEVVEDKKLVGDVQRAVAFIEAHEVAQKLFKEKFCGSRLLTPAEREVLGESRKQVAKAEEMMESKDPSQVENVVSHLLCTILLNKAASYIGNLVHQGLLKEREGEEYMHELVEHELHEVGVCVKNKRCRRVDEEESEDGGKVTLEDSKADAIDVEVGGFEDEPKSGSLSSRLSSRFVSPPVPAVEEGIELESVCSSVKSSSPSASPSANLVTPSRTNIEPESDLSDGITF